MKVFDLTADMMKSSRNCEANDRKIRACIIRSVMGMSIDGCKPTRSDLIKLLKFNSWSGAYLAIDKVCEYVDNLVESGDEDTIEILEIIRLEIRKDAPLEIAETWKRLVVRE
jgi:hypothetical protein